MAQWRSGTQGHRLQMQLGSDPWPGRLHKLWSSQKKGERNQERIKKFHSFHFQKCIKWENTISVNPYITFRNCCLIYFVTYINIKKSLPKKMDLYT